MKTKSSENLSRSRIGRAFAEIGTFLRKQGLTRKRLLVGLVLPTFGLLTLGIGLHKFIDEIIRKRVKAEMQTILHTDVTALKIWLHEQKNIVRSIVNTPRVEEAIQGLITDIGGAADPEEIRQRIQASPNYALLRERTHPQLETYGDDLNGFLLVDHEVRLLAASHDLPMMGRQMVKEPLAFFRRVLAAPAPSDGKPEAFVSLPFKSRIPIPVNRNNTDLQLDVPTMLVAVPIYRDRKAIAAFAVRLRPERAFTGMLQAGRTGETGETYAFDANGLLISNSRFDDDVRRAGLIAQDQNSILNIEIRDPGVDTTKGERPPEPNRRNHPLTLMASSAIALSSIEGLRPPENSADYPTNLDGYRDYRGVPVIGAWTWLPEYGFGVTTEIDYAEAFASLRLLQHSFIGVFVLLMIAALGLVTYAKIAAAQAEAIRQADMVMQQLGQYTLLEKIGAGGMGTVYKARHALLRRPTAVKILSPGDLDPESVTRFEREVQLTAQLTHPNTIAVFDFGQSPDGVFYYAMEYLQGMSLEVMVQKYGPMPPARVITILQRVCGSLAEAHAAGLVHRDIKPANIFMTERGGIRDFVKVLDFGLVKSTKGDETRLTSNNVIVGTPLYIAPEAIEKPDTVDGRADLYSLGVVGYYLLTAMPVFIAPTVMDLCIKHMTQKPDPPSQRLGRKLPADLEAIIMRCLEKNPENRFPNAKAMIDALNACQDAGKWRSSDADAWWREHFREVGLVAETPTTRNELDMPSLRVSMTRLPIDEPPSFLFAARTKAVEIQSPGDGQSRPDEL